MCHAKSSVIPAYVKEEKKNLTNESNLSTHISRTETRLNRVNFIKKNYMRLIEKGVTVPKELNEKQLNELINIPQTKYLQKVIRKRLKFFGQVEELQKKEFWIKKDDNFNIKIEGFKEITQQEKLEFIQKQHSKIIEKNPHILSELSEDKMKCLLECDSFFRIKSSLKYFLWIDKMNVNNIQEKNTSYKRKTYEHTLFNRKHRRHHRKFLKNRVLSNFIFNQPLIFDFGFNHLMSARELFHLSKQIVRLQFTNVTLVDPFPIYFHNFDTNSYLNNKAMMDFEEQTILLTKDDIDVHLPKRKLCYLSPDSPNEMEKFDEDTTYIIGCIVDLSGQGPLSYAKADALGIPTVRLPLDR